MMAGTSQLENCFRTLVECALFRLNRKSDLWDVGGQQVPKEPVGPVSPSPVHHLYNRGLG
jgi:hypothetical protein